MQQSEIVVASACEIQRYLAAKHEAETDIVGDTEPCLGLISVVTILYANRAPSDLICTQRCISLVEYMYMRTLL